MPTWCLRVKTAIGNFACYPPKMGVAIQSPEQMRNTLPLTVTDPPRKAVVFLPRCSLPEDGFPCDWKDFQRTLDAQIDKAGSH